MTTYWCIDDNYIEFILRGLETGERRTLASLSVRFVPSYIYSIFTVNTPILYLSCIKICTQKKCYLIL